MTTVQTTALKHAVHPSVRNPKVGKPKTMGEQIVTALVRDGLLPFRVPLNNLQAVALGNFLRDYRAAWGKSGCLGPVQFGGGGGQSSVRCWQPEAHTDAALRIEHIRPFLRDWELEILGWMIRSSEKAGASLTKMGAELYFVTDEKQAREKAATRIQSLSDTLCQHYPHAPAKVGYTLHVKHADDSRQKATRACRNGVPIAA